MTKPEAFKLTARSIADHVRKGDWSATEIARFYIDRTIKYAGDLGAYLHFDAESVLQQAAEVDHRRTQGHAMALAGVPIAIKDNIATEGIPTTCGSKMLSGFKPPYDAYVVQQLKAQGAIVFAKANCDEFAMGSSNENSAFGPVKNPWNKAHVPGGSSGGSAAAVAADLCPVALGSDTGGSIRQPAAFCGVVGLKPSYGRISRFGLVAYGSSLDQIGPLTRDVLDTALMLDVLSGHDPSDATCANLAATNSFNFLQRQSQNPQAFTDKKRPLRIGLVREFFAEGLDKSTQQRLQEAVKKYGDLGAEIVELSVPAVAYSVASYYVLATAEASANLARYDGVKYGYRSTEPGLSLKSMYRKSRSEGLGREVKQRIMLGTFALSSGYYDAYYGKAIRARQMIARDFAKAFEQVDLLLAPTSPTTAFKLGEKVDDPLAMYLSDICTLAVNLAGLPAVSIPCGFDELGLPVGLQLIGKPLAEQELLHGAYLYEQATQWQTKRLPQL